MLSYRSLEYVMEDEQQPDQSKPSFVQNIIAHFLCNNVKWKFYTSQGSLNQLFLDHNEFCLHIEIQDHYIIACYIEYPVTYSSEQLFYPTHRHAIIPNSAREIQQMVFACRNIINNSTHDLSKYNGHYEIMIICNEHKEYSVQYLSMLDALLDENEDILDIVADTEQWLSALFDNHAAKITSSSNETTLAGRYPHNLTL